MQTGLEPGVGLIHVEQRFVQHAQLSVALGLFDEDCFTARVELQRLWNITHWWRYCSIGVFMHFRHHHVSRDIQCDHMFTCTNINIATWYTLINLHAFASTRRSSPHRKRSARRRTCFSDIKNLLLFLAKRSRLPSSLAHQPTGTWSLLDAFRDNWCYKFTLVLESILFSKCFVLERFLKKPSC